MLVRLALCAIWYYVWISVIPRWKGYEHRQTVAHFDDGTLTHKIVKVANADLARWDEEHDAAGRLRRRTSHLGGKTVEL